MIKKGKNTIQRQHAMSVIDFQYENGLIPKCVVVSCMPVDCLNAFLIDFQHKAKTLVWTSCWGFFMLHFRLLKWKRKHFKRDNRWKVFLVKSQSEFKGCRCRIILCPMSYSIDYNTLLCPILNDKNITQAITGLSELNIQFHFIPLF